ncbi:hypothetical protein [Flavobacterium sp. 83]|uniref:hypothetical protein n=1 Tax=Flavobacterium sp. 83 TaxID=1131812 RepID=UPI0005525B22|nr:hypothetical protein [Flavobacterium sp. 83]
MIVPVKNIVETVELSQDDVLLPLLECVVNSIISLQQSSLPVDQRKIQIQIERGAYPRELNFENLKTIKTFKIIDNGIGFNTKNYKSFETPFSQSNIEFGCKGVGRFTVLAAFEEYNVNSNYFENQKWINRKFKFTTNNEIEEISLDENTKEEYKTIVEINNCNNEFIVEKSALSVQEIAETIMQHCFIYYLNNSLPNISIIDKEDNSGVIINELFAKVSKENERNFELEDYKFKLYITKTPKEGNRKNNYLYYCANNRTVGNARNLKNINSIFCYPLIQNNTYYFLDIYLVSDYLNQNVYKTRNGFKIPKEDENLIFKNSNIVTFQDIESKLSEIIELEYENFVREAKEKNVSEVKAYISHKAPRYNSFLKNPDVLKSIPPNLTEDKLEEHLYKISYTARKNVEENIQRFINNKSINEEVISQIIENIKEKTSYDVDSLADYMTRRKAILDLFDKFLDADENGNYKLEEDVHNLIFPLGLTNNELDYENHNLWLLDERFITYKFIASDKSITSYSQKNSRKELDLVLVNNPQMFDNPISFGDKNSGEVNSMVIFEFKRPGDIAHQKRKSDYRWQYSELIEPYFDEFLYQPNKKNYKGNQVVIRTTTPKFGFIILDVIPNQLIEYNTGKGWKTTPFGTYYKIEPELNMHIEVLTFRQLLNFSNNRHSPFFDKLFK